MRKTLLDISLVLSIVISLYLSVFAADALLGDTDWNIGIATTNPDKNVNAPGDIRASGKLTLQDRLVAAQDVDRTIPGVAATDNGGIKASDYGKSTAELVAAVNRLHTDNEQLRKRNLALEARVSEIESALSVLVASK